MKEWLLVLAGSFIGFCIGSIDDDSLNGAYSIVILVTVLALAVFGLVKAW